ncbi:MAG TPA: WYL domain-containing protein [Candidatus Companilactobacillus pullicola]|uniref:WYL domain-containing protein n=1 Tax=Candidatus Companilactobacillus pullicola TaxID=2838523 RepID=A0A9D1ZMJ7_9LACO|nr:WYL domain-containing protein [Candidatus Companilactobacillus pullicola]
MDDELTEEEKRIKEYGSRYRIVELLLQLLSGETFNIDEAMEHYGVKKKAIQLDLKYMRFLLDRYMPDRKIVYDPKEQVYRVENKGVVTSAEALMVLKMIIGTRTFSKDELEDVEEGILDLVSYKERSSVKTLLATTLGKYYPVKTEDNLIERIDKFANWILKHKTIEFTYNSSRKDSDPDKTFIGVPINLYFDTSFYYVMVYLLEDEDDKSNPRVFRIDRFDFPIMEKRKSYNIPFNKKVDEGEELKKTYLLRMGNDVHYKFQYWNYPQTALDKLPGSRIVETKDDGSVIIKGEIFSEGALLWIFSQGDGLKVLEPESLVREVKERLKKAVELYDN